jgi:sterol desaturase/sphingolipid hydroxylase (fatty acid hydroxylase superfamily)
MLLQHDSASRVLVITAMAALMVGEGLWCTFVRRSGYDLKSTAASLGVAAGHTLFGALNAAIVSEIFMQLWSITPVHLPMTDWRTWVTGFFAVEFAYYWSHRWDHTVRWLWATHAVHHSAQEFTLPAALRLGWTSALSGSWIAFIPLIIAGWHPSVVAALLAFNLFYQFFLHTEVIGRVGALEHVLNTPAHHRVHHASNACYVDKNFGGVLIVFDRMFGTFAAERPDEPCRYGLVTPLRSFNPCVLALHEWRLMVRDSWRAGSPVAALRVLFGQPQSRDHSKAA